MLPQRLIDRPVVPVSCLTPLSPYSMGESREMIGVTPVCITMEALPMRIEDLTSTSDSGTKKRRRRPGI